MSVTYQAASKQIKQASKQASERASERASKQVYKRGMQLISYPISHARSQQAQARPWVLPSGPLLQCQEFTLFIQYLTKRVPLGTPGSWQLPTGKCLQEGMQTRKLALSRRHVIGLDLG